MRAITAKKSAILKTPESKKIRVLLFAPHADDEAIMAGGLIARAGKELPSVHFRAFLMSDGFFTGIWNPRIMEFAKSCGILGITPAYFRFPLAKNETVRDFDSPEPRMVPFLDYNPCFVKTIASAIADEKPSAIIAPHPEDWHPDHKTTSKLVTDAVLRLVKGGAVRRIAVIFSQVWQDIPKPNLCIGFDESVLKKKIKAMHAHESQLTGDLAGDKGSQKGRVTYNRYDCILLNSDRRNAIMAPEKLFGPSSRDAGLEYAELFRAVVFSKKAGKIIETEKEPVLFLPKEPLTEKIFLP